ncbi:MAG: ABC transporter ATP-binding protein [Nitrospiria bacterium]
MSNAIIETTDLRRSFILGRDTIEVLRGVSLRVDRGETIGIVGASGAGKSTLLHLLGGLDRPTSGSLIVGGVQLDRLREQDLETFRNRTVGFIFQFHHLLPEFSALENVMMPGLIRGLATDAMAERAHKILADVGLAARVGHRPGELSGGEQQRVAIARALVLAPPLVLADEPTGNLDTHTSDEVMAVLKRLHQAHGTTFVIVTHNEKLAMQTDRVVRMVDGTIEGS